MAEIRDYAAKIAERFHPEKIILFGSFANGQPTEDSDVDLLVLMDFEGKGYEKATEIRLAITPPFALDLLIRPVAVFRQMIEQEGEFFWQEVHQTGRTLYARQHREVAA